MADLPNPSKSEIETIFKRLRSIPTNKTCFDCGAKNPTWSSVTYGIFICIDCSSVHRSLGVHISFVRSTQLDTQWTWPQLRSMQLGGNMNAMTFFRQHNCSTLDSQQKYHSRASALYKDKLANIAQQSMRMYGTQLHIDAQHEAPEATEKKEEDFFSEQESLPVSNPILPSQTLYAKVAEVPAKPESTAEHENGAGPSVDAFVNPALQTGDTKPVAKSLIGQRKPAAKKPGMGARKGLGATKIQTNFEDIEREAQLADSMRSQKKPEVNVQDTEAQLSTLNLTYQDLSLESKKQAEKLQKVDPSKAQQLERLGMGILAASSTGPRTVSHSAISDMQVISQDTSSISSSSSVLSSFDRKKYPLAEEPTTAFYSKNSGLDDLLGSRDKHRDSEWDMLTDIAAPSKSSGSAYGSAGARPTSTAASSYGSAAAASSAGNGEALKKFGNAKAISSDQFFQDANGADMERRANLSRFEGSTGISSSDYFGTGSSSSTTHSRGYSSNSAAYNIQTPDLDEVKESVRQGVTKVASKLSTMANNLASSIQDRYGY